MEQTRQQIREILATHVHYAQVEMEEDIKARQDKLDADNTKKDAGQEKRRADIKAFNKMMNRGDAE
jgi:Skp family chaperone for outer membrane proteins